MPYLPNIQQPQPIGYQGPYRGAPVPGSSSGEPRAFPGFNPYNNRDMFNMTQQMGQFQFNRGNQLDEQFAGQATDAGNIERGYGQTIQDIYGGILNNGGGGYTPEQRAAILQAQGLQDIEGDLPNNFQTQQEQEAIRGNPYAGYDMYAGGKDALQGSAIAAGRNAQNQVAAGAQHNLSALGYGQGAVDKAASDQGLQVTDQYLRQAGMSDQEVQQMSEAAARGVGAQFGATRDQLLRNAEAAGNSSPLAIASAMGALNRNSAASQADALLNARMQARQAQRDAASGIQNTQLQAGQYRAGLGTQAGLGIMNAALNANTANTGQALDAAKYSGNMDVTQANKNLDTMTGLSDQAEQNASTRAGAIAGNRQNVNQGNQNTRLAINTALSNRNQAAYAPDLDVQREARGAIVGQQAHYGDQANQATNFRLQGSNAAYSQAANAGAQYGNWGTTGGQGFGDKAGSAVASGLGQWVSPSGVVGAATGYGGFASVPKTPKPSVYSGVPTRDTTMAARGGLMTHHQLIEVGEGNRPEVILPLNPSTSPIHRNRWERLGAQLGRAMGIHQDPRNFKALLHQPHDAFGTRAYHA